MLLYTKVETYGNKIYFSGVKDGKKVNVESNFKPSYFIPSSNNNLTEFRGTDGTPLIEKECDVRDFYNIETNKKLYGTIRPHYQFINKYFPQIDEFDSKYIDVWFWDIEVEVLDKFPSPELADAPINLITLKKKGTKEFIVLSTKDYNLDLSKAELLDYKCTKKIYNTESEMLISFCNFLNKVRPHVLIGWNSIFFDWVYITNRIKNILGEEYLKSASPFGFYKKIQVQNVAKDYPEPVLDIGGICNLDLMQIFRKYTFREYESYSLDYIATDILGLKKLKEPDISFKDFMTNHWDDFVLYNIFDVYLVEQIELKTNLLDLVFTLAYVAGVNYIDVFSETRLWDSIIYRHLYKQKIIIPPKKSNKSKDFAGGIVKDTITGIHDWIVVFDFKSLYPSIIRTLNLSFETIQNESCWEITVDDIKKGKPINENFSVSAAGYFFSKEVNGTFPILMEKFFNKRLEFQKLKKEHKGTEKELVYDSFQLTFKILINSLFGAIGTPYFRFYDYRIASSITMSGQLAAKWLIEYTNRKLNEHFGTVDEDYVVANDTDSFMFSLHRLNDKSLSKEENFNLVLDFSKNYLEKWLNEAIDVFCNVLNAKEKVLKVEREPISSKGFFQTKKRYILKIVEKDESYTEDCYYKIRGLNSVRSSTPEFFRTKLNQFYEKLLMDDFEISQIEDFVKEAYQEIKEYDLGKIATSCRVNNIEKYLDKEGNILKGCPYNVRAAINYNKLITENKLQDNYPLIKSGEKAKILYLKENNPYGITVISFKDNIPYEIIDFKNWTDYAKIFSKELISPLEKVCEAINYNQGKILFAEEIIAPKKKRTRKKKED